MGNYVKSMGISKSHSCELANTSSKEGLKEATFSVKGGHVLGKGFMMRGFLLLSMVAVMSLAACGVPTPRALNLGGIYWIAPERTEAVQLRMADAVNALRLHNGRQPVALSAHLNAAALTHSRDMSRQNRPWHFGSDGSSPVDRIARIGYRGELVGEAISESYEDEIETLEAWMRDPTVRGVILDPMAAEIGVAWHQDPTGKLWWTVVLGKPKSYGAPNTQTAGSFRLIEN